MTKITRLLRSEVCKDSLTPPVVSGDANAVTFFTDTDSSDAFVPQAVRLSFDSTYKGGRGAIMLRTYAGTDTSASATYTDTVLLDDVAATPGTPFLAFYSFDTTTKMAVPLSTSTTGTTSVVNGKTVTSLPANSIAKVLRTDVSFRVIPSSISTKSGAPTGTQLEAVRDSDFAAQVYVRNSDYTDQVAADNDRLWGPRCS